MDPARVVTRSGRCSATTRAGPRNVLEDHRQEEDRTEIRSAKPTRDKWSNAEPYHFAARKPSGIPRPSREDHRRDGELQRRRKALLDLAHDGAPGGDALSEIARGRRLQVVPVLLEDGPVRARSGAGPRRFAQALRARRGVPPAGPPGRARIHRKTRIESPRRIGTRSSRRTTKRGIYVVVRRPTTPSSLDAPDRHDGRTARARPGWACSLARFLNPSAGLVCAYGIRGQVVHDDPVRLLV